MPVSGLGHASKTQPDELLSRRHDVWCRVLRPGELDQTGGLAAARQPSTLPTWSLPALFWGPKMPTYRSPQRCPGQLPYWLSRDYVRCSVNLRKGGILERWKHAAIDLSGSSMWSSYRPARPRTSPSVSSCSRG